MKRSNQKTRTKRTPSQTRATRHVARSNSSLKALTVSAPAQRAYTRAAFVERTFVSRQSSTTVTASAAHSPTTASRRSFSTTPARQKLNETLTTQLEDMKKAGTYKRELVITSPQHAHVNVEGRGEQKMLNFCANNYLGFSDSPELIKAAKHAMDTRGIGLSSVRFICGTQDIHKKLEDTITKFHGTEDTILFPSAFDANAGLFEAILTSDDAVISDELNHASIIDGIRLSKAERHRFKHMDLNDLERILQETQHKRTRLIVTDGAFSMDGHIADLAGIVKLAEKYNALTFVDDAHATGFLGKTGRGTDEYCGVQGKIDIINSTLGKAMGGASGGYTTGPKAVIDVLRNKARPYLFSNSVSPPLVAAAQVAFDTVMNDTSLRDKLESNTKLFRKSMTEAGFTIPEGDHPIVPIMLGDAKLASDFAKQMVDRGIYVVAFSFPVVPRDKARIRVQISAKHSEEDIMTCVNAFKEVRQQLLGH